MQSISLVPSTAYNDSLYTAPRKACSGGSIILEDRITQYYMEVTTTTSVTVDTSLCHIIPDSTIEFELIVYSIGTNVLNLADFGTEQIQVENGTTVFKVHRGLGCAFWQIDKHSYSIRPAKWLRCFDLPYSPTTGGGICTYSNFCWYDTFVQGIMSDASPYSTATKAYGTENKNGDGGNVYAKFPGPIWLQSVTISFVDSGDINFTRFPYQLQVLASNDGISWTEILLQELSPARGSSNAYSCNVTNYYTLFKFVFSDFRNSTDRFNLPSISLLGYESELINTGGYQLATPYCTALPTNGFNIESNSGDMSSTSGSLVTITQFSGSYYTMTRSSSDTAWEIIFTYPEAIRTAGISYITQSNSAGFRLFALSYSDDKSTWTEYSKVDGSLDAWKYSTSSTQVMSYFTDSVSSHRYYKVTIYSNMAQNNELRISGLSFIQFVSGRYLDFETFVPKLSANTQSGYTLVASNSSQGDAYKMFDRDDSTYGGGDISNGEWSLVLMLPQATAVKGMRLIAPNDGYNRMPYGFSLQGSADNDTWTNIKTFFLGSTYWTNNLQIGDFDVDNDTAYQYYRIIVTDTAQGSTVRIGEIGLASYASFKGVNWFEDTYLVPVMASASQDGYVASAKSYYDNSYAPWRALDRTTDYWCTSDADKTNANKECNTWIQIQLPTAQACNMLNIVAEPRSDRYGRAPSSFTLEGSNDSENWDTLLTVTEQEVYSSYTWDFENTTAYLYYRINVTKTNIANAYIVISQMNLINRITHESN